MVALTAASSVAACALGSTPGRLAASTSAPPSSQLHSSGFDPGDYGDLGETSTTAANAVPDTTAAPAAAPATSPPCADAGGVTVPSQVAGYAVTPDDSAALALFALPPGMQGTGLLHVTRTDGAVADLVSVTGAAYAFGDLSDEVVLDRFARSAGIVGEPAVLSLGGHAAVVVVMSSGSTLYAWMPCRGSLLAVLGRDAAMVADVVARVSR